MLKKAFISKAFAENFSKDHGHKPSNEAFDSIMRGLSEIPHKEKQMDIREFESIKQKIELLKTKKAKAEGSMESIKQSWTDTYGFSTIEEASKKLEELKSEQDRNEREVSDLYKELNSLTNWRML